MSDTNKTHSFHDSHTRTVHLMLQAAVGAGSPLGGAISQIRERLQIPSISGGSSSGIGR